MHEQVRFLASNSPQPLPSTFVTALHSLDFPCGPPHQYVVETPKRRVSTWLPVLAVIVEPTPQCRIAVAGEVLQRGVGPPGYSPRRKRVAMSYSSLSVGADWRWCALAVR